MKLSTLTLLFVILLTGACAPQDTTPWIDLFNGESLDGWTRLGGEATYKVEDDTIVGTTVLQTPNTFLCTESIYSDFILEYEFKLDADTNSGVQVRSNSYPEYINNRVHGYQIEIDPSERAWTGGIYDEARRGWLYPLTDKPEAQAAYRNLEWNKVRVEAIGETIKVWVNGIPTANLIDDMTREGFIALQVHGIGDNKDNEGITIRWKNIRIITDQPGMYVKAINIPALDNTNKLTLSEEDWGWKLLWDGETTEGWRGAKLEGFPEEGWEISNGELTVLDSDGAESRNGGDIVTIDTYSDFELRVDFKITPGANSGIKYFVDTVLNKKQGSAIGLEYQVLDDALHPDAKLGRSEGIRTMTALYDLIKPENRFPNPVGEWNHARIVSKGNHVEHWLNGRRVLEYERNTPEFKQLVQESKYKVWPGFGEWEEGFILLQDHGNRVSFRNIKIKSE
jgi:3-keto-disaccharide hydrolase